jgi:hypothetical protein
MTRDAQSEKYVVDYMTHGMLSASLLQQFSVLVFSDKRDTMTIGEFYDSFSQNHQSNRFRPFNEGVILGFLYWLLFARENWRDLVPDDDLSTWHITPVRLVVPKKPHPKLRYLVKRLRNALGHGTPMITVPQGTTAATMLNAVTITFSDVNTRDMSDTFEAELTLKDAFHLTKMLHKTVVEDAAKRHDVVPPSEIPT